MEEAPEDKIDEFRRKILENLAPSDFERVRELVRRRSNVTQDPTSMPELSPEAFNFFNEYCRSLQEAAKRHLVLKVIALGSSRFTILAPPKEDTELQLDASIKLKPKQAPKSIFDTLSIDVIRMIMERVPDNEGERAKLSRVCKQFFRAYYGFFGKERLNQAHYKTPEQIRSLIKFSLPICERLGCREINIKLLKILVSYADYFKQFSRQEDYPQHFYRCWDNHQPIHSTLNFLWNFEQPVLPFSIFPTDHEHHGPGHHLIRIIEKQKPTVEELFVILSVNLDEASEANISSDTLFVKQLAFCLHKLSRLIRWENIVNSTENNNNTPPPRP